MRKLNQKGFAHWILPAVVIVTIASIGAYVLTGSHADPSGCPVPSALSGTTCSAGLYNTMATPAPQAVVSGAVAASTRVTDSFNQVSSVQFTVDGAKVGSPIPRAAVTSGGAAPVAPNNLFLYNYSWDSTTVPNGAHKVGFIAFDNNGNNSTSSYVSVTVSNPISSSGEQLSIPPQRRPVQYVHLCLTGSTYYVTQGTPNCLPGGTFQLNYAASVPGTTYSVPCATNSNASTSLRLIYISSTETCPAGTSN
jgi:hypothetical protein